MATGVAGDTRVLIECGDMRVTTGREDDVTTHPRSGGSQDRDASVRLDRAVFERLCRDRGATTVDRQARLVGIPRRTLFRLFQGREPSLGTAIRLADALGVRLEVLFTWPCHRKGGE